MMIVDLIDLEDFAQALRELGVTVAANAERVAVEAALDSWLASATAEQAEAFAQLKERLASGFAGQMLPDVEAILAR